MDVQRVYYLRLFKDYLMFLIMVLMKAFQLHLYVLLGYSIPTEIIQIIIFNALDYSISKKSFVCGSKHTIAFMEFENQKRYHLYRYGDFDYTDDNLHSIDQIFAGHNLSFFLKDKKLYGDRNCSHLMYWLKEDGNYFASDFQQIFMSVERTNKISFEDGVKIKNKTHDYQPLNGFKSISCGNKCIFIITTEGLFACGKNTFGQLGIDDIISKIRGLKKIKLNNIISVSCGNKFTMALTKEGLFSCGHNLNGQLGLGSFNATNYSFKKANIQSVIAIECGGNHSLALTIDGLYACGLQCSILPFGHVSNYDTATFRKGDIQNVVSFKCGFNFCLILTHQGLFGCGRSQFGQLGYISKDLFTTEFFKINIDNVLSFDCGKFHSIIETTKGLFGCGKNNKGQLILNSREEKNKLVKIM